MLSWDSVLLEFKRTVKYKPPDSLLSDKISEWITDQMAFLFTDSNLQNQLQGHHRFLLLQNPAVYIR